MELDLSQLERYQRELAGMIEAQARLKQQIDYLRLQVKQTKQKAAAAKKDATLKAFIKAMPKDCVEVTPAPDRIYASIQLSCLAASLYRDVPEKLGLTRIGEPERVGDSIGAPTLHKYRHGAVEYYITHHIR